MIRRFSALACVIWAFSVALSLAGCAAPGTRAASDPGGEDGAIAAGRGRIYFYRTILSIGGPNSVFGNPAAPEVLLDGHKAGTALPGGVFFCDVRPGQYDIAIRGAGQYAIAVAVTAGTASYVRMDWGAATLTARGHLREVDASTGRVETEHRTRIAATCPD